MKRIYYTIDEGDGTEYDSLAEARAVACAMRDNNIATCVNVYENVEVDGQCVDVSWTGSVYTNIDGESVSEGGAQ